jgi:hypothetical protein
MAGILPSLGRGGIINSVRKLSGTDVPGYKDVDPAAEFIAGQVATLKADANGNPVLTTVSASTDKPIGIFFCHKAVSFYKMVTDEAAVMPASGLTLNLKHANIKAGYVKVANASTGTAYVITTNWTLDSATNGIIRNTNITTSTPVKISYLYEDNAIAGIDQTLGSGKAAYLSDPCEIATLVYEPATNFVLGGLVYSDTTGYITALQPGSAVSIGTVTKIPTASDPELYVRIRIA